MYLSDDFGRDLAGTANRSSLVPTDADPGNCFSDVGIPLEGRVRFSLPATASPTDSCTWSFRDVPSQTGTITSALGGIRFISPSVRHQYRDGEGIENKVEGEFNIA